MQPKVALAQHVSKAVGLCRSGRNLSSPCCLLLAGTEQLPKESKVDTAGAAAVARLLGGKPQTSQSNLDLRMAAATQTGAGAQKQALCCDLLKLYTAEAVQEACESDAANGAHSNQFTAVQQLKEHRTVCGPVATKDVVLPVIVWAHCGVRLTGCTLTYASFGRGLTMKCPVYGTSAEHLWLRELSSASP